MCDRKQPNNGLTTLSISAKKYCGDLSTFSDKNPTTKPKSGIGYKALHQLEGKKSGEDADVYKSKPFSDRAILLCL